MAKRVLVVEDDPDLQWLLREVLQTVGYGVDVAEDGLEALNRLTQQLPDLVVLDVQMPGMDGRTFARHLHYRGLRPALPVLFLTALSRADTQDLDPLADAIVKKPFQIAALLAEVRRLTAGTHPAPPLVTTGPRAAVGSSGVTLVC